jgi:hypothetical protein
MRPDADATLEDGVIVIRLHLDTMAHAAAGCPAFERFDEKSERFLAPVITDKDAFAIDFIRALNKESEDGSTMITNMFDEAFVAAADQGADGIVFPEDCEYAAAVAAKGA